MEPSFLERLERGLLVLDGGMGFELGPAGGRLLFDEGERVRALHERFLAAGCEAIRTLSFTADARSLARAGEVRSAFDLNLRAVELARAAAQRCAGPRYVLGSIGPGWEFPSRGEVSAAELGASYAPQLAGLLAGGVDALMIETVRDPLTARAALEAGLEERERAGLETPLCVSFSPEPDGRLATGASIDEALALLADLPVALYALNCGAGPAAMWAPLVELARSRAPRIGVAPNAGLPEPRAGRLEHPVAPEELADFLERSVRELGTTLVGACCGAGPAHISALARRAAGWTRAPRPSA